MSLHECAIYVDKSFPDAIGHWPEVARSAAYAARDHLLRSESGLRMVGERSYCIARGHERFPADVPDHLTHALVYEIDVDGRG